jgi:hypothetical protein
VATNQRKKQEWFNRGAAAFERVCPGKYDQPTYPCPICLTPFTEDALADGRLSSEHVPPASVGGRDLLLTCKICNNSSGTKLDADANVKELIRSAMAGRREHRERVKATIGDLRVNSEVYFAGGRYSLVVPRHINRPGTLDALKDIARAGTPLTVEYRPFSELGAKISWFRSGYLALFAAAGYQLALDPAMQIVRRQILECDERRMITFTTAVPDDIPLRYTAFCGFSRQTGIVVGPFNSVDISFTSRHQVTWGFTIGWLTNRESNPYTQKSRAIAT